MSKYLIERLGHLGDGIAQGPVFAPLTLPGETVTGDRDGDRLSNVKIVTPSTDRVSPPCKHFKRCGGCALQHGSDAFVAEWKANVVKQALIAQGLDAPVRRIHTSQPMTRRRATFTGRRTKSGAMVGFHARASDTVVETPDCQLLLPEIIALRPALEKLTVLGASRKGSVALAVTWSPQGADVVITNAKPLDDATLSNAISLTAEHKIVRLTWNDDTLATHAPPTHSFDGISVAPPPGAFLQATQTGENALRQSVAEVTTTAKSIVDLFAGCGTFALPLARRASIHAVESDDAMLGALDLAWRNTPNMHKVSTEKRDLFRRPLVPLELNKFDAVVIDPPRAGAEAQIKEIAVSDITTVAMVSCNPTTFARDSAILAASGFTLNWIDVVDQFRWSPHIELAASLTR